MPNSDYLILKKVCYIKMWTGVDHKFKIRKLTDKDVYNSLIKMNIPSDEITKMEGGYSVVSEKWEIYENMLPPSYKVVKNGNLTCALLKTKHGSLLRV